MIREILTVSAILLVCLFITNTVSAAKIESNVLYDNNNKDYCNKSFTS